MIMNDTLMCMLPRQKINEYLISTYWKIALPWCACCFPIQTSYDTKATDIQGRSQNLRHFHPSMRLKLGVFKFFSLNQNNCGSSGAYVTCIYCGLSVKMSMHKTPHSAWWSWMHFFACVLAKTRRLPIWAPWLTTPLYGAVYHVWDDPCISVTKAEKKKLVSEMYNLAKKLSAVQFSPPPKMIPLSCFWHTFLLLFCHFVAKI